MPTRFLGPCRQDRRDRWYMHRRVGAAARAGEGADPNDARPAEDVVQHGRRHARLPRGRDARAGCGLARWLAGRLLLFWRVSQSSSPVRVVPCETSVRLSYTPSVFASTRRGRARSHAHVLMPHQPSESLRKLCHDGNPLGMFWDELPGAPASAHTFAIPTVADVCARCARLAGSCKKDFNGHPSITPQLGGYGAPRPTQCRHGQTAP